MNSDKSSDNPTQQKGLRFLSAKARVILNEISLTVPSLLAVMDVKRRMQPLWKETKGAESLIDQLIELMYKYLSESAMKIIDEIRGLSLQNYELVVAFVHFKCNASRMAFQILKCNPQFFRDLFAECANEYDKRRKEGPKPSNRSNQEVQIQPKPKAPNTNAYNQCDSGQQQNYQSISTAGQSAINSQLCTMSTAFINSPSQTSTYQPTLYGQPIWQSNGSNELVTYQPTYAVTTFGPQMQSSQFQAVAVPQIQMQIGVCQPIATVPCAIQNVPAVNRITIGGQSDWSMQPLNTYNNNCVNTTQNQNAIQTTNALPILRSSDVAQTLNIIMQQNTLQHSLQMRTNNSAVESNSNSSNSSAGANYFQNQNKQILLQNNGENVIQNTSKSIPNNNQSIIIPNMTITPMAFESAPAPVSQTQPINVRKRSAAMMQDTSPIETAPPAKINTVLSNNALEPVLNMEGSQPNVNSVCEISKGPDCEKSNEKNNTSEAVVSSNTNGSEPAPIVENWQPRGRSLCEMPKTPSNQKENDLNNALEEIISTSIISPTAANNSPADTTIPTISATDNTLNVPNASVAVTNEAAEKEPKADEKDQCAESDDFEVLVQTCTAIKTEVTLKVEKTEIPETPPELCDLLIDLCEDSTDDEIEIVKGDIKSKAEAPVS